MNHPDFHTRRAFFDVYDEEPLSDRGELSAQSMGYTCPCCGYPTLSRRRIFEICLLCWWEDDGLDDEKDPGALNRRSEPNRMTLRQGRQNFEEHLHSRAAGDHGTPGMNDVGAIENNRRIVEAFDAIIEATSTEEILRLLGVVDDALADNAAELYKLLGAKPDGTI